MFSIMVLSTTQYAAMISTVLTPSRIRQLKPLLVELGQIYLISEHMILQDGTIILLRII